MLQYLVYGFAGLGCAVMVFLIARCISKACKDLKSFVSYAKGEGGIAAEDWL